VTEHPDWLSLLIPSGGGPCQDTVNGWMWYCDQHDTHGNADSEDEAHAVAGAHEDFMAEAADDDESGCVIYVWKVEPRAVSET
jgi:hypothetical protein